MLEMSAGFLLAATMSNGFRPQQLYILERVIGNR